MAIINDLSAPATRNKTTPYVQPATRTSTPMQTQAAAPTATGITPETGTMTDAGPNNSPAVLRPGSVGTSPTGGARPPGIVNGQTPQAPAAPGTDQFAPQGPAGSTINPVTREVGAQETVQGQLDTILKNGNPLLEAAKARAAQAANARGLQNSSMAAQAGEEAIVNTALPIASQDASTYNKQALVNQDIVNQFLSQDKGAKLDLEAAYEAFRKNNYMFDKDEKLKRYINDSGITSNEKIAALQAAAQVNSASIHAGASMYGTDKQLEGLGMTIEAQKQAAQAGFDQQDKTNLTQFAQQNFRDYAQFMNNINASEMPIESKEAMQRSTTVLYASAPLPPGVTFNLDALPGAQP